MSKKIEIYTSSATGMLKVKKDQQSLKFLLEKKKVPYVEYDVASDADKRTEMKTKSGKTDLPQIHVDGAYLATFDDVLEWEEVGELNSKLGL